jgi:acyl-CoA thioester hydrolase
MPAPVPSAHPSPLAAPEFGLPVRVYWEDTDAGGVVFYANYLKFFERARTEWLRSLGHGQEQMRQRLGVMFVVTDTAVRYLRPAHLDDLLDVTVHVKHAGRAQLTLAQQAWRRTGPADGTGPELVAEGTIRIACVDAGTFRPVRIPTAVCDSLLPALERTPSDEQQRMTAG